MVKPYFAVQIWGNDTKEIIDLFLKIEELGYDACYYGDGPFSWLADCFCILSYAASITDNLRLGPAVTYLEGHYRSIPAILKSLFTLQNLSKGRVDFRFGFMKDEALEYWRKFGIRIPNVKERIERVSEALNILRNLKDKKTFKGKYYFIEEPILPFPVHDFKIWLSANSKKTIEVATKHADILEISYLEPEKLKKDN